MDRIELLKRYQGSYTNRDYARLLGIHESYLSKCYDRKHPVGMKALQGLVRAFPQAGPDVLRSMALPTPEREAVSA